jgi:malonyl-CoA/methylmalonyl-CoA synthetase
VASNVTFIAGGTLLLLPKFDAGQIIKLMARATVLMGVPTFYVRLLQQPQLNAEVVRNVRLFVSGSAPLLAETHREWQARTGHAILERYGMTETNMIASNPYQGARVPGAVGLTQGSTSWVQFVHGPVVAVVGVTGGSRADLLSLASRQYAAIAAHVPG